MSQEKKSSLRDRLKNKGAAATATPATNNQEANPLPPVSTGGPGADLPPPPVGDGIPPPAGIPGIPGIPGVSSGMPGFEQQVDEPDWVKAEKAAAARAAKAEALRKQAEADPLNAGVSTVAPPAQLQFVTQDGRPVDDAEVGRGKSTLYLAAGGALFVGLVVGFFSGSSSANGKYEDETKLAFEGVRRTVGELVPKITDVKSKVDTAIEQGNIVVENSDEEGAPQGNAPQRPAHPPQVSQELFTWFQGQPPEPPLNPNVYAGRVGKLKSDIVTQLNTVQVGTNELWRQLQDLVHAVNPTNAQAALAATTRERMRTNELNSVVVTFARNPQNNQIAATLALLQGQVDNRGQFTIGGPGVPPNQTRTFYTTGALEGAAFDRTAFGVNAGPLLTQAAVALSVPWREYVFRLKAIKRTSDQLAQDLERLNQTINHH